MATSNKRFLGSVVRGMLLAPGFAGALTTAAMADGDTVERDPAPLVQQDPDATVVFPGDERTTLWRQHFKDECYRVGEAPTSSSEQVFQMLEGYLRQSDVTSRLLDDLEGTRFAICTAATGGMVPGALANYLHRGDAAIMDIQGIGATAFVYSLHELRHGWQDQQGVFDRLMDHDKQDRFALMYMMEADASAFSVAAAYQLRQAGAPHAWQGLQALNGYRDMAVAFEAALEGVEADQPLTDAQLRRGMKAAYDAWFSETDFPQLYTERHRADWAELADNGPGQRVSVRNLSQIIGQLPGQGQRVTASYIGMVELAQAQGTSTALVERRVADLPGPDQAPMPSERLEGQSQIEDTAPAGEPLEGPRRVKVAAGGSPTASEPTNGRAPRLSQPNP